MRKVVSCPSESEATYIDVELTLTDEDEYSMEHGEKEITTAD